MTLIVCPLSDLETVIAARAPSQLITLLDPGYLISTPEGLAAERHLRLGVNDVVEAVEAMGPGDICAQCRPFDLPARY
jgi:predicted protein tyrosine phosphatase